MRSAALFLTLLTASSSGNLVAQALSPPLEPGSRMRVTAPTLGFEQQPATLVAIEADTLVLTTQQGQPATRCPLSAITSVDVSRGQRSKTALGALLGFVGGAGLGAAVGSAIGGYDDVPGYQVAGMAAAAGGVAGLLFGVALGSQWKSEKWEEIPVVQLRRDLHAGRSYMLGVSLRF